MGAGGEGGAETGDAGWAQHRARQEEKDQGDHPLTPEGAAWDIPSLRPLQRGCWAEGKVRSLREHRDGQAGFPGAGSLEPSLSHRKSLAPTEVGQLKKYSK